MDDPLLPAEVAGCGILLSFPAFKEGVCTLGAFLSPAEVFFRPPKPARFYCPSPFLPFRRM